MSRKPDLGERLAIFLAWDRQCAWCWVPLYYNQMQVDHVIAKRTRSDDLPAILALHGLALDYDVWATENLVPSCSRCNSGKGSRPPMRSPAIAQMMAQAHRKADEIREESNRFATARGLDRHLLALVNASRSSPEALAASREAVAEILQRISHLGFTDVAEYRLASQWVTNDTITYGCDDWSTERRVWLVNPPGKQPVAVVLEAPGDPGSSTQNMAEEIARRVLAVFPSHVTVLHYDKEPDSLWGRFWSVVPFINGEPRFGEALRDHPHIAESLRISGLISEQSAI